MQADVAAGGEVRRVRAGPVAVGLQEHLARAALRTAAAHHAHRRAGVHAAQRCCGELRAELADGGLEHTVQALGGDDAHPAGGRGPVGEQLHRAAGHRGARQRLARPVRALQGGIGRGRRRPAAGVARGAGIRAALVRTQQNRAGQGKQRQGSRDRRRDHDRAAGGPTACHPLPPFGLLTLLWQTSTFGRFALPEVGRTRGSAREIALGFRSRTRRATAQSLRSLRIGRVRKLPVTVEQGGRRAPAA